MGKRLLMAAISAGALLAAGVANAGIVINTDFTTNAVGVTSTPGDNLSIATSISADDWLAAEVSNPLGGLIPGDVVTLTNPLSTAIGGLITISWDGGLFHDTTTTSGVSFVGDELDLTGKGTLFGPGLGAGANGILDLSFTQAGGAGSLISGSGSFVASSAIPEPSTWAMFGLGFGFLAFVGFHKKRQNKFAF
jgi:hypothetical protein